MDVINYPLPADTKTQKMDQHRSRKVIFTKCFIVHQSQVLQ